MDKIDISEIQKKMTAEIIGKKLILLETVDSTNNYALSIIKGIKMIPHLTDCNGAVVISETQTGEEAGLTGNGFHLLAEFG